MADPLERKLNQSLLPSPAVKIRRHAAIFSVLLLSQRAHGFAPLISRYRAARFINHAINKPISSLQTDSPDQIDEPCLIGSNIVGSCATPSIDKRSTGTQSKLSAATNLGKCICGAGSFALPHVFLKEGVLGGTIALTACAYLATLTMQSINNSRTYLETKDEAPMSYVDLSEMSLGKPASKLVFGLTLAASLGVCSTYIAFIGQTLASLSMDAESNNIVHFLFPNVPENTWEMSVSLAVFPLSLVRNYAIFAFTSALGVTAVLGGILVTLAYGILVDPGGGISNALGAVTELKLWPESFADAFGGSFGTIAYLFCVNFLTLPIINSMRNPTEDYNDSVTMAVSAVWVVNLIFAIICLGFYGDQTQDLVLQNLNNGPYLSALKILLCVDLLFTFPVVFSSGRQILENALLESNENYTDYLSRALLTAATVLICFGLSQIGGFGVVANLVGGVVSCCSFFFIL